MALGRLPEGLGQHRTDRPRQRFCIFLSHCVLLFPLLCGLRAKYERAHHARGTPSTVDHGQVVLGDLTLPGAAYNLARRLDHVSETTSPTHRLAAGYLAAVSVHGEGAFVGRIDGIKERANLALLAE